MTLSPTMQMDKLPEHFGLQETAAELLDNGYRLVPLCALSKIPTEKGWQEKEYGVDDFEDESRNIGIKTGGPLVVVDVDSKDPAKVQWVLDNCGQTEMRVHSPHGTHLYYGTRAGVEYGNKVKIRGEPYDLRWKGCFIVTAGSRNSEGVAYTWAGNIIPLGELPILKVTPLRERKRKGKPLVIDPIDTLDRAVRRAQAYIARIFSISGEGGHNSCYRAVCKLRDFGLSPEQAWPALLAWNETNAIPKWTEAELRHKIASVFGQR